MLVVCLITSLLYRLVHCQNLLMVQHQNEEIQMIQCVIGILNNYFSEQKDLTYVDMHPDDQDLLRMIHETIQFSLISRESTHCMTALNHGYIISSPDVNTFTENFDELIREPLWNPTARFLIVIKSLKNDELNNVFDALLRQHVTNVLLVNGTNDANLYTYNPFDNYACGRYYETVINYGLCTQTTYDLYPEKLVNGLKNCTFRGTVVHRPPFTIDPVKNEYGNKLTGMEQYVIETVAKTDGFKIDFNFILESGSLSKVYPNMTAMSPMDMLQKNETDLIFGGMLILPSHAAAFSFICGHHDYVDELRFAVTKSLLVPNWKYFYLEFEVIVWALLLLAFVVYSAIMIIFLRTKDKGQLILKLLDNLLLHGHHIHSPMRVKCFHIMWMWFAYLVNTFYQSSLVSLTTNPIQEYQITDEIDMAKYNLRPCIGKSLVSYMFTEPEELTLFNKVRIHNVACEDVIDAMKLVSTNKNMFTLIPSYFYLYNEQAFNDKWGDPLIYYFEKPYTKLLLGFYFYKGFPLSHRVSMNMMHMRENGLAGKKLHDQYYKQSLKFNFFQKDFTSRFVCPWYVYGAGCFTAAICFIIELMSIHLKWYGSVQNRIAH